jgi:hypothetical protein
MEARTHTHMRAQTFSPSLQSTVTTTTTSTLQTDKTHTHTHTHLSKSTGGSQISGGDAACESSTESISQGRELVSGIVDRAIWLGSWGRRDGSWTHMAAKKTRSLHFRLSKAKRVPPNSMGTGV